MLPTPDPEPSDPAAASSIDPALAAPRPTQGEVSPGAVDPFAPPKGPSALRLLLMAPLGLVRGVVLVTVVLVGSAVIGAFSIAARGRPLRPGRPQRRLRRAVMPFVRAMLACVGVPWGLPAPITGGENLRAFLAAGRGVMIYNHVSILDGLVLHAATSEAGERWPAFLAWRDSLFMWPIAKVLELMGGLLAMRTERRKGLSRLVADRIREGFSDGGPPLAIAPEGDTSNGHALLPFHTGAFVALEPVLPVLLRYGESRPPWAVLHLLCQPSTPISVEFLPAVPVLAGETPAQFSGRVRAIMAKRLGVPLYDLKKAKLK